MRRFLQNKKPSDIKTEKSSQNYFSRYLEDFTK